MSVNLCDGSRLRLAAHSGRHFLCANDDKKTVSLAGTTTTPALNGILRVIKLSETVIAFETVHGTYLCAERRSGSLSQKPKLAAWEKFTICTTTNGPDWVSFKTAHGQYLRAYTQSEPAVVNSAPHCKGWEQWKVHAVEAKSPAEDLGLVADLHPVAAPTTTTSGTLKIKLSGLNGAIAGPNRDLLGSAPQRRKLTAVRTLLLLWCFLVFIVCPAVAIHRAVTRRTADPPLPPSSPPCDPSQLDVSAYLSKYPDILAWIEDWTEQHYLQGQLVRKEVPLDFDHQQYWARNPEVNGNVKQMAQHHFATYAAAEGRHSCPEEPHATEESTSSRHAHVALRHQALGGECGRLRRLLIRAPDLEVGRVDPSGLNALHYATKSGHADCVRFLRNAGAE